MGLGGLLMGLYEGTGKRLFHFVRILKCTFQYRMKRYNLTVTSSAWHISHIEKRVGVPVSTHPGSPLYRYMFVIVT